MFFQLPHFIQYSQSAILIAATVALITLLLVTEFGKAANRNWALAVAILPAAILIASGLSTNNVWAVTVFYVSLLLLSIVYFFYSRLPLNVFRPRNIFVWLPQAIAPGQILGALALAVIPHTLPFATTNISMFVWMVVLFSCAEVIFFQGIVQTVFAKKLGQKFAAIIAASFFVIYAAIMGADMNSLALYAVMGGCLAAFYYYQQNIPPIIVASITAKIFFVTFVAFV